jgi:fumagillin biosynthesis dioxygenase
MSTTTTTNVQTTYGASGKTNPSDYGWARKHLQDEGWVVIPDILTPEEADHVNERLWKAKEAADNRGDLTYIPFLDPNASNVRVFYLMELDKVFRDLISHPVAVSMVKSVLGEDFLISNFTANIARPGSKSMALHSDQSIVVPDPWKVRGFFSCRSQR